MHQEMQPDTGHIFEKHKDSGGDRKIVKHRHLQTRAPHPIQNRTCYKSSGEACTTTTTRRFLRRPNTESLLAIGWDSP